MKEESKKKAIVLRRQGYSLSEVSIKLKIAKSTASVWLKDIELSNSELSELKKKIQAGRLKGVASNKFKKDVLLANIAKKAKKDIFSINGNVILNKLFCSLLFWGEGSKSGSDLRIINSDPELIKVFLKLLRISFSIDESKFRVVLHLHKYHNIEKQKRYWSKITDIPLSAFKVYLKANTGKNKKEKYQGCVSVRYYDYKISLELTDYYKEFSKRFAGLV